MRNIRLDCASGFRPARAGRRTRREALQSLQALAGRTLPFGAATLAMACASSQAAPLNPHRPVQLGYVAPPEAAKAAGAMRAFAAVMERFASATVAPRPFGGFSTLLDALGAPAIDLAWVDPLAYIVAADRHGARLVTATTVADVGATEGRRTYQAGLICKTTAPFASLKDLKGKKLAFVDEASAAGYLYTVDLLARQGVPDARAYFGEVRFSGSHERVALDVLSGTVDAGALAIPMLNSPLVRLHYPWADKESRVLVFSSGVPYGCQVVRAGVSDPDVARLRNALLKASATPEGRRALHDAMAGDWLSHGFDQEYQPLRNAARLLKFSPSQAATRSPRQP